MSNSRSLNRAQPVLKHLSSQPKIQRCAFSTTPTLAVIIPPVSPKYVFIPQPPQQHERIRKPQKGVLPRPRKIFDSVRYDKASPEAIAAKTPEPTKERKLDHLTPDQQKYIKYKAEQSELRRQNLRSGLVALRARKDKIDTEIAKRSATKQARYQERVARPERLDEQLTRPSILQELQNGRVNVQPDPDLPQILEEKRQRHAIKSAAKTEERRNYLHTLYMNAGDFIVTPEELDKKIEEEFEKEFYVKNPGRGIWDAEGIPETTSSLMNRDDSGGSLASRVDERHDLERERAQRVAEVLTGGKI